MKLNLYDDFLTKKRSTLRIFLKLMFSKLKSETLRKNEVPSFC